MRRRFLIWLAAFAAVGVAVGVTILGLALTQSERAKVLYLHARTLSPKVDTVGRLRIALSRKPPHLSENELRSLESLELNEGKLAPKPTPSGAEHASSDSVPPTKAAAADALTIFTDTFYRRSGNDPRVGSVAEPYIAMNGERALVTWNWGAAVLGDGATTFQGYLDPFHLPTRRGAKTTIDFCDQLAAYLPGSAAVPSFWIWIVQAGDGCKGSLIRVLWQRGDWPLSQALFRYQDLLPRPDFQLEPGSWLDQPRIGATKRFLFLSINAYNSDERFIDSYVIRIATRDFARSKLRPRVIETQVHAPVAFTQGSSDAMYFAGHSSAASLRVWKWPDSSPNPTRPVDVSVSAFGQREYVCRRNLVGAANWCGRNANDTRITTGWIAKGVIGFAWNAAPSFGFPFPYVAVAQLDADTLKLRDEPSIHMSDRAFEYAAVAPNARGELGGVALMGGGSTPESCVALRRDPLSDERVGWSYKVIDASDSDPSEPLGDYLGSVPTNPGSNVWAGSCMTVHGGGVASEAESHVEIHVATFGRASDTRG